MALIGYLNFKGNSAEVIDFYKQALDAKDIKVSKMRDMQLPPEMAKDEAFLDLIANASLKIEGGIIMISDIPDYMQGDFKQGNNITITIVLKSRENAKKYFDNLAKEGKVIMPMSPMPWSALYGMVEDKFGVGWQINCTDDEYYYTI